MHADRDAIIAPGAYVQTGDVAGRDQLKIEAQKVEITQQAAAATPAATSLHQLPSPPRDFTGRQAELDELTVELERRGVTISGLTGMGGVGKTALALKLAEEISPRYPDAHFYVNLKGTSPEPLSTDEAMAHVIHGFLPEAKTPKSDAELRGLYRSVLHDKRALLLMDNAACAEQVEPLIPPHGCALLVTSRQHFTVPGLFAKNLDVMPAHDARDLLVKIAPRIGDQADEIAELCGHLPLALRLAAAALAQQRDLTVPDYVQRLRDPKYLGKFADAALAASYDLLNEESRALWRALAVFPETFDTSAAAAV